MGASYKGGAGGGELKGNICQLSGILGLLAFAMLVFLPTFLKSN